MNTYTPGQKVITETPEYFKGARLEGEYLYFKSAGILEYSLHKIRVTSPFSGRSLVLGYYDEEVQAV